MYLQVLEADRALYATEFEAGDVPEIKLDSRGKESLTAIDLVLTKLGDSCREAERRDDLSTQVCVSCLAALASVGGRKVLVYAALSFLCVRR